MVCILYTAVQRSGSFPLGSCFWLCFYEACEEALCACGMVCNIVHGKVRQQLCLTATKYKRVRLSLGAYLFWQD